MVAVSIIVPIFNVEHYLDNCLKSIENQSFTDFECLMIDDCSCDGCSSICKEYEKKDKRFKYIKRSTNGGVSVTRNTGIDAASGEYLVFIDSDDVVDCDMLSELFRACEDGKYDIVQCNFKREKGLRKEAQGVDKIFVSKGGIDNSFYFFYPKKIIFNSVCAKIFKRKLLQGIRFDDSLHIGEDLKFSIQCFFKADQIKLIPFEGYSYINRPNSSMTSAFSIRMLDDFKVNDWILQQVSGTRVTKYVLTRDAATALECYYGLMGTLEIDQYKNMILERLQRAKKRYKLSLKYELSIFLLNYFPHVFEFLVKRRYRKKVSQ